PLHRLVISCPIEQHREQANAGVLPAEVAHQLGAARVICYGRLDGRVGEPARAHAPRTAEPSRRHAEVPAVSTRRLVDQLGGEELRRGETRAIASAVRRPQRPRASILAASEPRDEAVTGAADANTIVWVLAWTHIAASQRLDLERVEALCPEQLTPRAGIVLVGNTDETMAASVDPLDEIPRHLRVAVVYREVYEIDPRGRRRQLDAIGRESLAPRHRGPFLVLLVQHRRQRCRREN